MTSTFVLNLQRNLQKLSDMLRISVGKYFLYVFIFVVSCNYLKSESVDHVRKNSAPEKRNAKELFLNPPSKWEREFAFVCPPT